MHTGKTLQKRVHNLHRMLYTNKRSFVISSQKKKKKSNVEVVNISLIVSSSNLKT